MLFKSSRMSVESFSPALEGIFLFSTYRLLGFCLRPLTHSRMLSAV